MGKPIVYSIQLATADDNGIATSQMPSGAGNLTLNGALVSSGVAVMDVPRRIAIASDGDDSGLTFTVYGNQRIDGTGNNIQETVTGPDTATVATSLDFGIVTRIAISGGATGNIIAGTNGVASTPAVEVNTHAQPVNLSVAVVVSGTVSFTGQYTYDQFWLPNQTVTWWDDANMTTKTGNTAAVINDPITGYRVTLNSGDGSITATFIQAGIKG